MNAAELRAIGEHLSQSRPDIYGRGWQSALARQMGVSSRRVRQWLAGDPIPESRANHILLLVK